MSDGGDPADEQPSVSVRSVDVLRPPTTATVVVVTVEVLVTALMTRKIAKVETATMRTVAAGQILVRCDGALMRSTLSGR